MKGRPKRHVMWIIHLPALYVLMAVILSCVLSATAAKVPDSPAMVMAILICLIGSIPLILFAIWYIAVHTMSRSGKIALIIINVLALIPSTFTALWWYLCATTPNMFR
jgi:hypothetical protein